MANTKMSNRLLESLRAGKQTFGIWQMLPGAALTRTLSMTGVDWLCVDCEHGYISDEGMHASIHSVKYPCTPIVRVPDFLPHILKRALDAGTQGIVCPMVNTVAQAEAIVQACYFPPKGIRGFGSPFSMAAWGADNVTVPSFADYFLNVDNNLMVCVQIETAEALQNVEEIVKVDGVHMLLVGPFDLSNSLGCPLVDGETDMLRKAVLSIRDAAHAVGKFSGIYCTSEEDLKRRTAEGWSFIAMGSDVAFLQAGLEKGLSIGRTGGEAKSAAAVRY